MPSPLIIYLFIITNIALRILLQDQLPLWSLDPRLYKNADDDDDDDYDIPDNHIGRIWFRVEYEKLTEKLLVTVIKARNLVSRLQMAPGDFFVRFGNDYNINVWGRINQNGLLDVDMSWMDENYV